MLNLLCYKCYHINLQFTFLIIIVIIIFKSRKQTSLV